MRQTLIAILVTLMGAGCIFEPEGIYEVEVEELKEGPGQIEVNLNFITDTLYLQSSGYTSLTYSSPDPLVRMVNFMVNEQLIGRIESHSGTFQATLGNQGFSENTPYTLRIELFRSSGSGSLADKLMVEGFLYFKEVTLIFVNRDKLTPKITRAYPISGHMVVEWEMYKGAGFQSYHIFNTDFRKIAIIDEQYQTVCLDDSQIGYGGEYWVVTVSESESYRSPTFIYRDNLPPATVKKNGPGEYLIEWGKSKYEKNLLGYRVYEYLPEPNKLTEIAFINDPSVNSHVFRDPHFPLKTRFFVQPVGIHDDIKINDNSDLYQLASTTPEIWTGERIPGIVYMFFEHPLGQYCYFGDFIHFYKFDTRSGAVVDSIRYEGTRYSVSPDGKTILIGNHLTMHLYDAATMEIIREIPFSVLPENQGPLQFLLSSDMTAVLFYESANYYFFDFKEDKTLAKFRIDYESSWPAYMKISPSGKYFAMSHYTGIESHRITELFERSGNTVLKRWNGNASYFDFDPHESRFIYFYEQELHAISPENMQDQVITRIPDHYLLSIDWNRNECLTMNANRNLFSVRKTADGETVASLKTQLYHAPDYFFLSNKVLFSNYNFERLYTRLNY